jgi:transcriptional regulator with PAS, ATPase and Fis domain
MRRVGGSRPIPVDVRLIAATNRSLRAEVKRGNFREDLYFRVAGAQVYVPPLRDRLEDLDLLAESFLAGSEPPKKLSDIPDPIWNMFRAYRWPGNVRELRNALRRVLVTPDRPLVYDSDLEPTEADAAPSTVDTVPLRVARRNAADTFERRYLEAILAKSRGNVTRAAAIAEVSRQVIHKLIAKHGL